MRRPGHVVFISYEQYFLHVRLEVMFGELFLGLTDVLFSIINVSRPNSFGKYSNSASSAHMSQVICKCTVHR